MPSASCSHHTLELPGNGGRVMLSTATALHPVTVAPCHGAIAVGAFQPAEPVVEATPTPPQLSYRVVAPSSVQAGHNLQYTVTLTNVTNTPVVFGEACPIYHEDLYAGDAAAGPPLGKHFYVLNCRPVGSIAPGASVTFAMVLDVPATAPTGRYTLLWSADETIKDIQRVPIEITPSR